MKQLNYTSWFFTFYMFYIFQIKKIKQIRDNIGEIDTLQKLEAKMKNDTALQ